MSQYAPEFKSTVHSLPWGDCNDCGSDLRYFLFENALHWIFECVFPPRRHRAACRNMHIEQRVAKPCRNMLQHFAT
jgi:hypothetical protein